MINEARMISYSTNWMGPISMQWFRDRGLTRKNEPRWSEILQQTIEPEEVTQQWSGGRIDIYGTENAYPEEIGLPIMLGEDWDRFSKWLDSYKTETVETLDKILESYYNDGNPKITWDK